MCLSEEEAAVSSCADDALAGSGSGSGSGSSGPGDVNCTAYATQTSCNMQTICTWYGHAVCVPGSLVIEGAEPLTVCRACPVLAV